jgi:hypothetical protein
MKKPVEKKKKKKSNDSDSESESGSDFGSSGSEEDLAAVARELADEVDPSLIIPGGRRLRAKKAVKYDFAAFGDDSDDSDEEEGDAVAGLADSDTE